MQVMMEEIMGWANDLLHGMLDPAKIVEFVRAMGVDLSQLPGMIGGQSGFDPYQVFGLDRSASDEEIKSRYHELLFKLHPDTSGTEATRFLLQLVLASYNLIKGERGWKQ
jgi:DnaJ-domain-containing protein 1